MNSHVLALAASASFTVSGWPGFLHVLAALCFLIAVILAIFVGPYVAPENSLYRVSRAYSVLIPLGLLFWVIATFFS